jgi:hypothetical protein
MGAVLITSVVFLAITTGRGGTETLASPQQVDPLRITHRSGAEERAQIIARMTASSGTMAPERIRQAEQAMRQYADTLTRHEKMAGHTQLLDITCYAAGCVASFQSDSPVIAEELRESWVASPEFHAWPGGKIYTAPVEQHGAFLSEWILLRQ